MLYSNSLGLCYELSEISLRTKLIGRSVLSFFQQLSGLLQNTQANASRETKQTDFGPDRAQPRSQRVTPCGRQKAKAQPSDQYRQ